MASHPLHIAKRKTFDRLYIAKTDAHLEPRRMQKVVAANWDTMNGEPTSGLPLLMGVTFFCLL